MIINMSSQFYLYNQHSCTTETEHSNLHKGRLYCRAAALALVSVQCSVYSQYMKIACVKIRG